MSRNPINFDGLHEGSIIEFYYDVSVINTDKEVIRDEFSNSIDLAKFIKNFAFCKIKIILMMHIHKIRNGIDSGMKVNPIRQLTIDNENFDFIITELFLNKSLSNSTLKDFKGSLEFDY